MHRSDKKRHRQQQFHQQPRQLELLSIIPLTANQRRTFSAFHAGKNLFLNGVSGSGKTYISLYLALKELSKCGYEKIIIYRSTVPTRDLGFLRGNMKEKLRVFEAPYQGIFQKLFNRGDAYEIMKQKNLVQFESTAHLRGITIENSIVIVDEIQNMNLNELYSIITRLGTNCRLILCGDHRQTDLVKEMSGIQLLTRILKRIEEVELIEFDVDDIVRSGFIKNFIMACIEENVYVQT